MKNRGIRIFILIGSTWILDKYLRSVYKNFD
jgi:hypothetical protein